ncbi:MAG: hypothetical protein AAGF12_02510 [Myxococcota bacterium]
MSDLKLNRLRKQGHGLILEEYSNCEVPAGCGGVVLRWVRPGGPCQVDVRHLAPTKAKLWIDGVEPERERVVLESGPHVICLEYRASKGSVLLATLKIRHRQVQRMQLHSAPDGAWRSSWSGASEEWREPGFDDSEWEPMVEAELPKPEDRTEEFRVDFFSREGAKAIAPASKAPGLIALRPSLLRVRRRFEVTVEGLS